MGIERGHPGKDGPPIRVRHQPWKGRRTQNVGAWCSGYATLECHDFCHFARLFRISEDKLMTQTASISCINKQPRNDPHHRITHVGGVGSDGTRWKITTQSAIDHIDSRTWEFWTKPPIGHGQKVFVASHLGNKYLKTVSDSDTPDNLLSLPECP